MSTEQLQVSVNATSRWLSDWRLTVNTDKTVVMEFTRRPIPSDLAINLNGTQLRNVKEQRHLGLILSSDLRWTEHTNRVLSKAARLLHTLRKLRNSLSRQALLFYYCLYIRPVIEYASVAWPKLPAHLLRPVKPCPGVPGIHLNADRTVSMTAALLCGAGASPVHKNRGGSADHDQIEDHAHAQRHAWEMLLWLKNCAHGRRARLARARTRLGVRSCFDVRARFACVVFKLGENHFSYVLATRVNLIIGTFMPLFCMAMAWSSGQTVLRPVVMYVCE